MKRRTFLAFVVFILPASGLYAQQIAGNWQAELKTGSQEYRLFLQVAQGKDNGWRATLLNIGRGREAISVRLTAVQQDLKLQIDAIKAVYEGKISDGGAAINGTWTQEGKAQPLRFQRATGDTEWQHIRYITVEDDVILEVIDWGGSGRPLVLLTGLGNTAHIFDMFAPKLTSLCHVYGITRRGFGISSAPESGYSADRLGDDVLAVIDALKLDRPVLAGHSIGGEELSSVGLRHPEKVSGLIYLDAAYGYAFYDPAEGDFSVDLAELRRKLEKLQKTGIAADGKQLMQELLKTDLPQFAKDLESLLKNAEEAPAQIAPSSVPRAVSEITSGMQKYMQIQAPVLALCAGKSNPAQNCAKQAKLVERSTPSAKFLTLPDADHFLFLSYEDEVLREIKAFIESLP